MTSADSRRLIQLRVTVPDEHLVEMNNVDEKNLNRILLSIKFMNILLILLRLYQVYSAFCLFAI